LVLHFVPGCANTVLNVLISLMKKNIIDALVHFEKLSRC